MPRITLPITALVALLVIAAALPASAQASQGSRVVYAAPGGNGDGSEQNPWGNLEHALSSLEAGDTLYLRGGTYRQRVTSAIFASGTPNNPITVAAYPGETPIIQGLLEIRFADHWVFDGLTVVWDDATGNRDEPLVKLMNGVGWTFRNSEVAGARSYAGVYVGSTRAGEPRHWRLEGNCIRDTLQANGPGFQDHNIYVQYVQNGGGGPGVIERNVVFNASNGNNIKLGAGQDDPGAHNVAIRYNTLYNATQNILFTYHSHSNSIERNVIVRATGDWWYPNLRGFGNQGSGNVARDNVGHLAHQFIRNTHAHSGNESPYGIRDGGNNRFELDPRFGGSGCAGFVPRAGGAFAYGHASPIERVSGAGRVETSVALSQATFPTAGTAGTVIVARADAYPDALAGAPLAAKLGAPVLLTSPAGLHPAAADEVRRLGARKAVLLGGQAALSNQVEQGLRAAGVRDVERIAGRDRFDTARLVAEQVGGTHAYIVEGASANPARGWPDAVAVSSLAAFTERPILLVTRDSLPEPTRLGLQRLNVEQVDIVGGEAAVSAGVQAAIVTALGEDGSVERIAGRSRYDTSLALARAAVEAGADPGRTWLATGRNWPDALAAGPAAAAAGGLLLLVDGDALSGSPDASGWVSQHASNADLLRIVGGSGAVAPAVEDALAALRR